MASSGLHGFLCIDKPAGITSHDVVARVRRIAGERRVGHAGTLDPAATGVLVVALGAATRLIEYMQDETTKRYLAVVELGRTTTTDDAEGEQLSSAPVPELGELELRALLGRFVGEVAQVPPQYSALHHQGRRMHELARAGVEVELSARTVRIDQIALVGWAAPLLTIDVICGKGTYIRALARDLGAALGCGGTLASLRRTAVGRLTADDAVGLEALAEGGRAALERALLPPEAAVADWLALELDARDAQLVRNGMPIARAEGRAERARAHAPGGALLALLAADGERWRPTKVFDWT